MQSLPGIADGEPAAPSVPAPAAALAPTTRHSGPHAARLPRPRPRRGEPGSGASRCPAPALRSAGVGVPGAHGVLSGVRSPSCPGQGVREWVPPPGTTSSTPDPATRPCAPEQHARSVSSRPGKGRGPGHPLRRASRGAPRAPAARSAPLAKFPRAPGCLRGGTRSYRRRPALGSARGAAPGAEGRSPPSSRPLLHPREAAQPERRRGAHPPGPRDVPASPPARSGAGGRETEEEAVAAARFAPPAAPRARPREPPRAPRSRQRPGPGSPAAESPRVPGALLSETLFGRGSSLQQANDD